MGLLNGLMGRATEIAAVEAAKEIPPLLAEDEQVAKAYKFARDVLILTTRRVIFVNRQGISGSKVEYLSIPYRTMTRFSVERAGNFDLDAELKVWVSGVAEPYQCGLRQTSTFTKCKRCSLHTCYGRRSVRWDARRISRPFGG